MFRYTLGKDAIENAKSKVEILRVESKPGSEDWPLLQFLYRVLAT
jgi:hypothetical protein